MIGGQIVATHAMAKQPPLSQDVLWTRRSPVICFICLSGLPGRLRLAVIDRHVSLLHAKKNTKKSNVPPGHRPYATADDLTDSMIIAS